MELIGPSIFSVLFEFLYMIKVFLRQASLVFIHQILEQTADGFYLCRKWIVLEYLVVKETRYIPDTNWTNGAKLVKSNIRSFMILDRFCSYK